MKKLKAKMNRKIENNGHLQKIYDLYDWRNEQKTSTVECNFHQIRKFFSDFALHRRRFLEFLIFFAHHFTISSIIDCLTDFCKTANC